MCKYLDELRLQRDKPLHQAPINNVHTQLPLFVRVVINPSPCVPKWSRDPETSPQFREEGGFCSGGYNLFCGLNLADCSSSRYRWLIPFLFTTDVLDAEALGQLTCLITYKLVV
jgi:hypothetical protein